VATDIQTCYRHPDRRAGVSCQRCDRPICPSCMSSASVGFHCPECARAGKQKVFTAKTLLTSRPLVTQLLVAVNVAVFLVGALGGGRAGVLFDGNNSLLVDGGLNAAAISHNGEWWRILTSGFLHFGVLHLAFNMYALWILGGQLEAAIGKWKFLASYLAALVAGALGALILTPNALTAGASAAIYGLLGVLLAAHRSRGISIWDSGLGGVLLINLFITFGISNISIGGHIGGLAGGFICGFIIYDLGPKIRNEAVVLAMCGAVAAACFAGALVVASSAA
jgi:membrane associated rhomboid family serine protease